MNVIIIGNGTAGNSLAKTLSKHADVHVTVYSNESVEYYSRPKLPQYLESIDVLKTLPIRETEYTVKHEPIVRIYRDQKIAYREDGSPQPYDKLVIATGSNPRKIFQKEDFSGIHTLRNYSDAYGLIDSLKGGPVVVLGGGLLGLEAALALKKKVKEVYVIESADHILCKQVNNEIAEILTKKLTEMGLTIIQGKGVKDTMGKRNLEGLILDDGTTIKATTLLLSIGVIPAIDIAKDCGLDCGRAIKVNAQCQTSDKDIYAVGDCAEYNGQCPGLIPVALGMAKVASASILGEETSYQAPTWPARFVAGDIKVAAFGCMEGEEITIRRDGDIEVYSVQDGIIRGIVLCGKLTSLAKATQLLGKPFDQAEREKNTTK
jgi:nitrite reductase (NADH) large subunit